jgi:predicted dienelactone hydrolase
MRPLELALTLSIIIICLLTLMFRRNTLPRFLYAIPALIGVVHAIPLVEGVRWQMVPAYTCALLLLVLARQPAAYFKRGLVSFALGGGVISALLATLLPITAYPAPTGPYSVGTTVLYLEDPNRAETYGDDPEAQREIAVQIWYPMETVQGTLNWGYAPVILTAGQYADIFAQEFGLPPLMMSHVGLLQSHSYLRDAPQLVADDESTYPVIIGSHGWRGFRALHTSQFEALASHGYIAVGIDHTYGAMSTVLQDGRAVPYDPNALPDGIPDDEYNANGARLQDVFEGDIALVVAELERLNTDLGGVGDGGLRGRLDLERIGLFGHSTGGGAVVQFCQSDERCKAGMGMDPWVEPLTPDQIEEGVSQPFLFMRSEPWLTNDNAALFDQLYDASDGETYNLAIAGTLHRDFTMQGILSPLLQVIGFTGKLDPVRTLDIVNAYMVDFFDHALKDAPAPLLEGTVPDYPEVIFE